MQAFVAAEDLLTIENCPDREVRRTFYRKTEWPWPIPSCKTAPLTNKKAAIKPPFHTPISNF